MWVAENRVEEYKAAGYKLAADSFSEEKKPIEEVSEKPVEETPAKTVKKPASKKKK